MVRSRVAQPRTQPLGLPRGGLSTSRVAQGTSRPTVRSFHLGAAPAKSGRGSTRSRAGPPTAPRVAAGGSSRPRTAPLFARAPPVQRKRTAPASTMQLHRSWRAISAREKGLREKHPYLVEHNKKYRGIDSAMPDPLEGKQPLRTTGDVYLAMQALFGRREAPPQPAWRSALPTRSLLHRGRMGRPDGNHSFTQEASFETSLFCVLTSGYLDYTGFASLADVHPLILHLSRMLVGLHDYNFSWLADEDPHWKRQQTIPTAHVRATTAAMFHYRMHAPDVMRWLGGTYTGEYRFDQDIVPTLRRLGIDPELIAHYIRATTVGCPNHFVAESSRDNFWLYMRRGNHPTVTKFVTEVMNNMEKEHRNRYNLALPIYLARFIPHLFLTPQAMLVKGVDKARLIFDASIRWTMAAIPINRMTSTRFGTELACLYGDTMRLVLERIWNLRITFPTKDIVVHANDVKSCFRQLKLHPDVMPAFSIMVADFLFLQTALPFGTDFSPQNWEACRRIIEALSERLFKDKSLRKKHEKYLKRIKFGPTLSHRPKQVVIAKACSQNRGVLDSKGQQQPTPHRLFVDDGIYAEVYKRRRIEQAIAASIEAIFIILGKSGTCIP